MDITTTQLPTWLDHFPTEILFMIFDYLSSNDIIYTFFFFNERFNNLLLNNKDYFRYLNLPRKDFHLWKSILLTIGSKIECLNINSFDLFFPLTYFPNLKSLIISSSYGLSNEQFELIFKSDQFKQLNSLKLKQNHSFSNQSLYDYSTDQDFTLKKIFCIENSLEIFQCSLLIPPFTELSENYFQTNFKLHSLTLILTDFEDIFTLISYTPDLEYLNIHTQLPTREKKSVNMINIKLKQLYLKFSGKYPNVGVAWNSRMVYNSLKYITEMFTLSLTCLSLNFVNVNMMYNDFTLNSQKLQQLLEPLIELKQLYFYAKYPDHKRHNEKIFEGFENQYWFDHNWSFGMHGDYLYTLPFHFDYLHEVNEDFNNDIFINNRPIWYSVKGISLSQPLKRNSNFLEDLKKKMPNLTFINFIPLYMNNNIKREDKYVKKDNKKKISVRLNNLTTIECTSQFLDIEEEWIINALSNVTHLILSSNASPVKNNELVKIFYRRIQQLTINLSSSLQPLIEINSYYFFYVKHIICNVNIIRTDYKEFTSVIMNLLLDLQNLKTLLIYKILGNYYDTLVDITTLLDDVIKYLDMKIIMKKYYQIRNFNQCLFFQKQ